MKRATLNQDACHKRLRLRFFSGTGFLTTPDLTPRGEGARWLAAPLSGSVPLRALAPAPLSGRDLWGRG